MHLFDHQQTTNTIVWGILFQPLISHTIVESEDIDHLHNIDLKNAPNDARKSKHISQNVMYMFLCLLSSFL